MPKLGEVKYSADIGRKGTHKNMWVACKCCGKERWVQLAKGGIPISEICRLCRGPNERGDNHPLWNGGRHITNEGYVITWIDKSDPLYKMRSGVWGCLEHRLVMARHLGRCLEVSEIVHHKNGNRTDNRIENLEIMSKSHHGSLRKGTRNKNLRAKSRRI